MLLEEELSRPVDWGSATGATAGSSSARASYRSRSPASHPDRRSMGRSRRTLPSQAQNRRPRSLTGRTDRPLRCIHIACQHCQRSGARRVGADRVIRLNPGPQRGDLRETVGAECHCHGREEPARVMPRQRPAPQQQGARHLQIVLGSANRFCQPSPALRGLRDVDSPPWLPAGIIAFTLEELFEVAGVLMNQLLLLSETPARLPQSKSRDRGDSAWCADDHEKARGSTYFRLALEAIALPPMQSTPTTVNARPRMKPIPAPMLAPPPSADVTILKRHDTSARTSPKIRITKPALVAAFMPTPFKQGLQYPRSDFYQICVRRDNRCWLPPNMPSLADSRPGMRHHRRP